MSNVIVTNGAGKILINPDGEAVGLKNSETLENYYTKTEVDSKLDDETIKKDANGIEQTINSNGNDVLKLNSKNGNWCWLDCSISGNRVGEIGFSKDTKKFAVWDVSSNSVKNVITDEYVPGYPSQLTPNVTLYGCTGSFERTECIYGCSANGKHVRVSAYVIINITARNTDSPGIDIEMPNLSGNFGVSRRLGYGMAYKKEGASEYYGAQSLRPFRIDTVSNTKIIRLGLTESYYNVPTGIYLIMLPSLDIYV